MKNTKLVRNSLVTIALLFFLCVITFAQQKPYQFLAKMFTEALGKIPIDGWAGYDTRLTDVSSMRSIGIEIYTSTDYESRGYDNASRVLTLFRGALNREPDSSGFWRYYARLNSGESWSSVVTEVFNSPSFTTLAQSIIDLANGNPKKPYYGWGPNPVIDLPITPNADFNVQGDDGTQLQALLHARTGPTPVTVTLAQKLVVRLMKTLHIPWNVTLMTVGAPDHFHYAEMARLIRGDNIFPGMDTDPVHNGPLVVFDETSSGAKLMSVWLDGQRSYFVTNWGYGVLLEENYRANKNNLRILTHGTCEVSNCRVNDPIGPMNIQTAFSDGGTKNISYNLLTGYATDHFLRTFPGYNGFMAPRAEGIHVPDSACHIFCNQLVDITDAAICVSPAYPQDDPPHQHSVVEDNLIVNAGNSAVWGILVDPEAQGDWPTQTNFDNTRIHHNTLLTSPSAHMDIALGVGSRTDYHARGKSSYDGIGASFSDNTSGTQRVTCNVGILVDGMISTTVSNNSVNTLLIPSWNLPEASLMKNSDPVHASGNLQPGFDNRFTDVELDENDHSPIYISGPSSVSIPSRKPPVSYTWTALRIDDIPVNPASFLWKLYRDGVLTTQQNGGETFGMSFWPGDSGGRFVIQCDPGEVIDPRPAKKYFVAQADLGKGSGAVIRETGGESDLPSLFALHQNYPNPFNPSTTIHFDLPRDGVVSLIVFDVLGREVTRLAQGYHEAGRYTAPWNATSMAGGVYFARLIVSGDAGENVFTKNIKLILMK